MRISTDECLDMIGYILGEKTKKELKQHLRIYNDWGRVKQLVIAALIQKGIELDKAKNAIAVLQRDTNNLRQLDAFPPTK